MDGDRPHGIEGVSFRLLPPQALVNPTLRRLLRMALGGADEERLAAACDGYRDRGRRLLVAEENGVACALIGVRTGGRAGEATITHLAVAPERRRRGLGRLLIDETCRRLAIIRLSAETDADAVGFYRRCGFTATILGQRHPGVERFVCERRSIAVGLTVPTGSPAMDLACASICYRGYAADEVAATLEMAPAIGYRAMEVHGPRLWSVPAADAFDIDGFVADLAASGMACAGLYTPGWGGRDDADVAARASAIARCVAYAEALSAHHVTCTGAERRDSHGALPRLIECVRQVLAATASDSPVKLTIEPHLGNALEQEADFESVLQAVPDPRLGVCVDTGHFHAAGVDMLGFIQRHADRIYAVHLKDHVGATSVGIGRGEVDLAAIVAALREAGYAGFLTIELEVEDTENLPRYTDEAYLYTSGLLGRKL